MQRSRSLFLFAALLFAVGSAAIAQATTWHFTAEEEGSYPRAEIPAAVLRSIESEEFVQAHLRANEPPLKRIPKRWLRATAVQLGDKGEAALVVEAIGELAGANVTPFWIFRMDGAAAQRLLMVPAHDLQLGPDRRNGYLVVEAVGMTVSTIHTSRFVLRNGRYVVIAAKSEEIR